MKSICVDGYNIGMPRGSGIATYGRSLLTHLQAIGLGTQVLYGPASRFNRDNVVNEAALIDPGAAQKKVNRIGRYQRTLTSRLGWTARPVTPTGEIVWPERGGGRPAADYFWAAQDLFNISNRAFNVYGTMTPVRFAEGQSSPPTVMNWTSTVPLYARKVFNIYTIHDLIPLKLPHTTLDNRASYFRLCKEIARRADHIVVVSETTRQDVIRLLGVEESRVTNTYQTTAIPAELASRPLDEVILELEGVFQLGWKDYFLYYGAIEPKKNLGRIIEAYLASGLTTPLVIVGGRAWLSEGETSLLAQVQRDGGPAASRIRQYEFMPQSMLISLIRGAKATVFPSLYEGFGLPVLESMSLGTAVLTSTGGALPEVAGDAAVTVDPYDVRAMTRGLQQLDADDGFRQAKIDAGLVQAERFSSDAYRGRLTALYTGLGVL